MFLGDSLDTSVEMKRFVTIRVVRLCIDVLYCLSGAGISAGRTLSAAILHGRVRLQSRIGEHGDKSDARPHTAE